MDTKLRSFSHSLIAKIIVFIIVIVCFTGSIASFVNVMETNDGNFDIVFEENYYQSREFINESSDIVRIISSIIVDLKSEEHILNGGTITDSKISNIEDRLFSEYRRNNKDYNYNASEEENYNKFKEAYADRILKIRDEIIQNDVKGYYAQLIRLEEFQGIVYYGSDGDITLTNSSQSPTKDYFMKFPSYMLFDKSQEKIEPNEIKNNKYYHWITSITNKLNQDDVIYVGFSDEYLNPRIEEWKESRTLVSESLYRMLGFLLGLIISFIYLIVIIGRRSFNDKEVQMNTLDRLYNDINIGLCLSLIALWFMILQSIGLSDISKVIILVTAPIATLGLLLVLGLVKHVKNKTLLRHTLVFTIIYKVYKFIKDIFNSGSLAVKIVVVVILYPILTVVSVVFFPITMGVAAWFALKKVKEFNAIKEGVKRIKDGDIHHTIEVLPGGEFGELAQNINSITDGLNNAVRNELKSERLRTELITNVSHDIRTPLTSIITYVDLLKQEEDPEKAKEYIEIIDQKSERLKTLTDDLFEAAKASSGNIPVNYEKIDIVSLITQGLGELNDKIEEEELDFKLNFPKEKLYVKADGKLLWRAIENLLSNIFKYALSGSRVYIDINDLGNEIVITFKNISAYELNISADELMERFKRGDESRNSQGSGLGLSIAKSLIDIQKGSFNIEIDGDLFKAIIKIPKE